MNPENPRGNYALEPLTTDTMILNMGPHHPATHGVLRFILRLKGEIITEVTTEAGYLHRSMEKIGEKAGYTSFMPYTDRIDYLAAVNCNAGYALPLEKLAEIEVPERATWLRMLGCELNRIASHLMAVGALIMDAGAYTPFTHCLRERDTIMDFLEEMTGNRITSNYARIGGVATDVTDEFLGRVSVYMDYLPRFLNEFQSLISGNKIFIERLKNIGIVSAEEALDFSFSGPNLRASGVDFDLRKAAPYMFYDKLEFETPTGRGTVGTIGDTYDRYIVRLEEIEQSRRIIKQILSKINSGDIRTKIPKRFIPPKGEIYFTTESVRGELGFYIVSDGVSEAPVRIKIRTGSFTAVTSIEKKVPGMMIPDMIVYFASLDIIAPEVDR